MCVLQPVTGLACVLGIKHSYLTIMRCNGVCVRFNLGQGEHALFLQKKKKEGTGCKPDLSWPRTEAYMCCPWNYLVLM